MAAPPVSSGVVSGVVSGLESGPAPIRKNFIRITRVILIKFIHGYQPVAGIKE